MTAKNIFLSVAVPTPIRCLFDYLPEKNAKHEILQPGLIVSVSFGQRKNITGIIVIIFSFILTILIFLLGRNFIL